MLGRLLDGVFVATVMRPRFVQAAPETPVEVAVDRWLLRGEERALAVVEGDFFVGLVTMSDALKLEPREWASAPLSRVMTPLFRLELATPGEPLEGALERMLALDVSQLPVSAGGSLVGLLCRADLARFLGVHPSVARRPPALWAAPRARQAALAMAALRPLDSPAPPPGARPPPTSGVVRCHRSAAPPPPAPGPTALGEQSAHLAEPLAGTEEVLDRLNDDVRAARRRV